MQNAIKNKQKIMNKKSLQQIEDFYLNLGYKNSKLKKVLEMDEEYQDLLKERKNELTKKFKLSAIENKKYILSANEDFEILKSCKKLEKLELSNEDRILVELIKTQLENNWRIHLIKISENILKKYEITK